MNLRFLAPLLLTVAACGAAQDQPDLLSAHDAKLVPMSTETISFADHEWNVRAGAEANGAGPNFWGTTSRNVEVDDKNRLHLRITNNGGQWTCAEIMTPIPFGTRGAIITLTSPVADLDPNVVIGMFAYRDDKNEADIELGRWGGSTETNAQYIVHTPTGDTAPFRFSITTAEDPTTIHTLNWGNRVSPGLTPGREAISFSTIGNFGRQQWEAGNAAPNLQRSWLHVNVWLYQGQAPQRGQEVDVTIGAIRFY